MVGKWYLTYMILFCVSLRHGGQTRSVPIGFENFRMSSSLDNRLPHQMLARDDGLAASRRGQLYRFDVFGFSVYKSLIMMRRSGSIRYSVSGFGTTAYHYYTRIKRGSPLNCTLQTDRLDLAYTRRVFNPKHTHTRDAIAAIHRIIRYIYTTLAFYIQYTRV